MSVTRPTIGGDDEFPAQRGGSDVRPPNRAELLPCRMLLPEAFRSGRRPDLLLATGRDPLRYEGVLAFELVHHGGRLGWRIEAHVARAARLRGVGGRLVAEIARRGRRRGVGFLLAEVAPEDRGATSFLASAGFRVASRCATYEGDLSRYRSAACDLRDRLAARGKVPDGARVVSPRDAPAEALDRLAREWAARAFLAPGDLSPSFWERPAIRDASAVLMLGDRAIGGIVAEVAGDSAGIAWRSIDPEFRLGWANIILSAAVADRLASLGVRRIRFSTTEETPDTENGVKIYGADGHRVLEHYRLELAKSAP